MLQYLFSAPILTMLACTVEAGFYSYKQGGSDWGRDYELCDTGLQQSPIDLRGGFPSSKLNVNLSRRYKDYLNAAITTGTGSTVRIDFKDGDLKLTGDDGED
jgi:carbonic anhydrase